MSKPLVISADENNRFDLDKEMIYLKIPVPNSQNEYYHKKTYYLGKKKGRKAILVHITNDTTEQVCGQVNLKSLKIQIPFSEVTYDIFPGKFKPKAKDFIHVYIINDILSDFLNNSIGIKLKLISLFIRGNHIWGCNNFYLKTNKEIREEAIRPEEAGGGVIIKNP
jgi:hypothetical protein